MKPAATAPGSAQYGDPQEITGTPNFRVVISGATTLSYRSRHHVELSGYIRKRVH